MASEKILNQKKEEVSALAAKMKEAKLVLLTDYRGINVEDVTNLRTELRNAKAEYKVIKNNITRRALAECGIEGLEDQLTGPTAVIMSNEDYLEPAKAIYKFSKDNDFYKIKGGVIDSRRNNYFSKITIKRNIIINACWSFTWKYLKTCSCT